MSSPAPLPRPPDDASPEGGGGAAPPLVRARSLLKRFGDFVAVDGIDFDVNRGEAFGLLGPNGAGKTSAMRMIGCTSRITGGDLSVLGLDPITDGPAIRERLGVVPQTDNLDVDLSAEDNLTIYGRYFGIPRGPLAAKVAEQLRFVQLAERRHDKVDHLSGGMRRRLVIARALLNDPELVLLDEPTTGLDPQARHLLWERLWELKAAGTSLLLTTHYMDEAEQLCDRLVIMDQGRIKDEGSPASLIAKHCTRDVVELRLATEVDRDEVLGAAGELDLRTETLPDRLLVYADDGDAVVPKLAASVDTAAVVSALVRRSTLEDVFLTLTGRTLVEG
ncbi:MAG: ABC transporter ATP-binding protein [Actinomycetota bacterium]